MSFFGTLLGGVGGFLVGGPAGAIAGASIGSSIDASKTQQQAAQQAAQASTAASDKAIALQQRMYEENVARQQPWLQAGQTALNQLIPLATNYSPFTAANMYSDPGYQFRLAEGLKALERNAAARGGLISGGALKAAERFGQDFAANEYQNAFNRYQAERQARLNPLQSLAGVGQTTAQQLGTAGAGFGTSAGNLYAQQGQDVGNALLAAGQARASMYGGVGNVLGRLYGSGVNLSGLGGFGTALNYGTLPGSQQTNMLAAQEAGFF